MFKRKCKITFIAHGATVHSMDGIICDTEKYPKLNEFGEEITKGYYKVHNLEELKAALNKLIIQKDDTLKEERKKCMEKLIMPQIGTAGVIMNYLIEKIKNGGD